MGVVYYGTYLSFLETGRIEALRQAGAEYGDLVKEGIHSPVVEAHVHYRLPATFDDVLSIESWVTSLDRARFGFGYRVIRERDGALLLTADTVHACVDAETLRPVRIPEWVRSVLARLQRHG